MNKPLQIVPSSAEYKIVSIKLSEDGLKAMHAAFPLKALQYADEIYSESESSDIPYFTYKELCIKYCRTNGMHIDFKALNSVPVAKMMQTNPRLSRGSAYQTNRTPNGGNPQKGNTSPYTPIASPEHLEKLRQSELRWPTLLKPWQLKIPHHSLIEPSIGRDGRPLPITYNKAMSEINIVEQHDDLLKKLLGALVFKDHTRAQCERTMDLIDYNLKDDDD